MHCELTSRDAIGCWNELSAIQLVRKWHHDVKPICETLTVAASIDIVNVKWIFVLDFRDQASRWESAQASRCRRS